jgi:O-acetyl-ADP-ribose deacetylase (regulator of RNase III)
MPYQSQGKQSDKNIVTNCVESCLELCEELQLESVSFPCLTSGGTGFDQQISIRAQLEQIKNYYYQEF